MGVPFVVGQWVRGEKFFGRSSLIREILDGPRDWLWVLGARRTGKTSLLRQLELLTEAEGSRYFPLYWDLQGATNPAELHESFHEALLDIEARCRAFDLDVAEVPNAPDLFSSLRGIRRHLRTKGLRLLLLCDEVEELVALAKLDPSLLGKLRHALQTATDMRSVLTSTIRLWALTEQKGDTSPFLHGFTPPIYIGGLADDEALALIDQANRESGPRPRINEQVAAKIMQSSGNHPYLVQILCKRYLELGGIEEAVEQVAGDPMVSYFFSIDFDMLSEGEKRILRILAGQETASSQSLQQELSHDSSTVGASLYRLEQLGYLRRDGSLRFTFAGWFFRRWLTEEEASLDEAGALGSTLSVDTEPRVLEGRYDLLERAGTGAQGTVYRAMDRMLQVPVAIKVLKPENAANEDALERLRREIILARDIAHPNIVRIYHLGTSDGLTYLIMQWIEGMTLSRLIARDGPLDIARARDIAAKLASALAAAHGLKVLHRDIKPSNVIVDGSGEPHLGDFGLARLMEDTTRTGQGVFLGTPNYASPEQADGRSLDERSDIYSLGVVMFEMVTGRRPFSGRSVGEVLELHRREPPPDPGLMRPDLPEPFSLIILRCLEKDPARRPRQAAEINTALEGLRSLTGKQKPG